MKNTSLLILAVFMFSCTQQVQEKQENKITLNVDSLKAVFISGWNSHDSTAIMNVISENAIVMNDSLTHKGKESIAKNWVSGGIKVLSNIKTVSVISGSSETIAYDAGTYTLDLNIPGGPALNEAGNYTLIWEKQSDQTMKLTTVHIEDITRMPDVQ